MGEGGSGNIMNPVTKLAKILGAPEEVILNLENKMSEIFGKRDIIEKIVQENDSKIDQKLAILGLDRNSKAEDIYQSLIEKAKQNNQFLFNHFNQFNLSDPDDCRDFISAIKDLTGNLSDFFIKEEKLKELFRLNPPKKIMGILGYEDKIDEMLDKEDVFELFCALRFVEDGDWLNKVFFKAYTYLTKDDFEKRPIRIMVLPKRWSGKGQEFLEKKFHHMSHLKEVGVVFIIPVIKDRPNESLYYFFMTLHYTYEVDWHARLFEKYSQERDFVHKMTEALKVQVSDMPLPNSNKMSWRMMPAYLDKKNPDDPRLAEPHISPEAWHYTRAAVCIDKFSQKFPDSGFDFWRGSDVLAEYFSDASGQESLISFDLFDNGISLLHQKDFNYRYLYHQPEALWNKIFIEYAGEKMLDKTLMENLDKGYVTLGTVPK
ncbi:MAG: hypothetical protein AVO34_02340 [Firmicutes bacterium ML8_F2]|nr:MAG: hypothetical protein AVO34_02340 [Firmicutes bacterium ML8_F2]